MWRRALLWRLAMLVGLVLVGAVVFVLGGYDDSANRPIAVAGLALYAIGGLGLFFASRAPPRTDRG